MPLTARRPQFLTISITGPDSASHASSDGLRTPAPVTPLAYAADVSQAALAMTPDTPAFDLSPLDGASLGITRVGEKAIALPWTEDEDAILQTALLRPAGRAHPPGTIPPREYLDRVTNEVIARYTTASTRQLKRARASSLSSIAMSPILSPLTSPGANKLEAVAELFTPTEPTFLDLPRRQSTSESNDISPEPCPDWPHTWSATRDRLFEIARLESRAAVGGHRRNQSESIVPVSVDKRNMPQISFGVPNTRSAGSYDGTYGDKVPTITEAVRLSAHLQDKAMDGASELHSAKGLFSPVKIEFGGQVNFAAPNKQPLADPNPIIRKAGLSHPVARPAITGRPSLLQRGVSYTTADLAYMTHSRNASASSDITMTDVSLGSPGSTSTSPTNIADRDATLAGNDDAFDSSGRSDESVMFSFSFPRTEQTGTQAHGTRTQDADPFTPLHQTAFPASVHGLGPRRIGQSPDGTPNSHIGSTPDKSSVGALTGSSENSPFPSAYPSSQTTPRLAEAMIGDAEREQTVSNDSTDTIFEFDRLSISNHDTLQGTDRGVLNAAFSFGAPAPPTSRFKVPKLTRSRSELSPLCGRLPIPPSASIPANLADQAAIEPLSPTGHREAKRQRALVHTASIAHATANTTLHTSGAMSGSGRRLNPSLTVIVPKLGGVGGEPLRSPFEHKIPQTNGSIAARD